MATDKQLGFYFDQTRCMSCNACTVQCKDWNQLNPGLVNWRTQFTYENANGFFPLSLGCNHCENPACQRFCPYSAISKDDKGIVSVDRAVCQENKSCITACPFGKPQIADDKQEPHPTVGWQKRHPMQKCTMCKDRLAKDEQPACVASCVGRALEFGVFNELVSKHSGADVVRLNKSDFPYAYVNNAADDTLPCVLIKKKPANSIKIHKK